MYQGLNQFDTQRKMFAGKPAKDHYEKGYLPMQKFFGQKIYQSLSATRKNRYRDRYKKNPRNNAWDFEANVEAIIEWYLEGLSQKTQFYLLKYFSFIYTKEQWKNEMACYWMLCNSVTSARQRYFSQAARSAALLKSSSASANASSFSRGRAWMLAVVMACSAPSAKNCFLIDASLF